MGFVVRSALPNLHVCIMQPVRLLPDNIESVEPIRCYRPLTFEVCCRPSRPSRRLRIASHARMHGLHGCMNALLSPSLPHLLFPCSHHDRP